VPREIQALPCQQNVNNNTCNDDCARRSTFTDMDAPLTCQHARSTDVQDGPRPSSDVACSRGS